MRTFTKTGSGGMVEALKDLTHKVAKAIIDLMTYIGSSILCRDASFSFDIELAG